jgi:hypothetical protein
MVKEKCYSCTERIVQPQVGSIRVKKRTGVMAVLRGMYSVLHTTQPKVGSIRVKKRTGAMAVLRGMYSPKLDLS